MGYHPPGFQRPLPGDLQSGLFRNPSGCHRGRFCGENGRTVHVEGRVSCRFDDAGHVVETRGIFRDISERKQTEEHFSQIHETYLGIFNSLTEAIYIQDEKGTFLEVNKGAEDFTA
jgi:PAS domain-containing protein